MVSQIKVNEIIKQSGSSITIGESGDTITLPSTATLTNFPDNTPSFKVNYSGAPNNAQDAANNTYSIATLNGEVFDTDNCYDNSTNYRFTPTVAGKYFVFAKIATDTISGANLDQARIFIYKNGTSISIANLDARGNTLGSYYTCNDSTIVDMNGSSDYVELYGAADITSGTPYFAQGSKSTYMCGFKIIGA